MLKINRFNINLEETNKLLERIACALERISDQYTSKSGAMRSRYCDADDSDREYRASINYGEEKPSE